MPMIRGRLPVANTRLESLLALPERSMLGSLTKYARRLIKAGVPPGPVLIVDDEDAVVRFVDRVLRDAGYKTATASNGPDALEKAKKIGVLGALVTDVIMPGMTGDELARVLRQTEPGLKVLYLTGYSDRLFKEKSTLWADEAFLEKPCTIKGLTEALSLLMNGHFESAASNT
jgi:CheY-like chemotaxis protein